MCVCVCVCVCVCLCMCICIRHHRTQDPCEPKFTIAWARFDPDKGGATLVVLDKDNNDLVIKKLTKAGGTCWYCFRIHNCIWIQEYNLSEWKAKLANEQDNPEIAEAFPKYKLWLKKNIADALDRGETRGDMPQFSWPNQTSMHKIHLVELVWAFPKARFLFYLCVFVLDREA